MIIASLFYSAAGFVLGLIVGTYMREYRTVRRVMQMFRNRRRTMSRDEVTPYDPKAPIPSVIPQVLYTSDGEPIIAREQVQHPSPVPRSIAIIVILLAAMSFAYNIVQEYQRNQDVQDFKHKIQAQVQHNTDNAVILKKTIDTQAADEQRLERLVLAISTAHTSGQVAAAIQAFLEDASRNHPSSKPATRSSYRTPHASPSPLPSARASPSPSHSPSPSPSPSSSPSPSPAPLVCVTPQVGPTVCVRHP